MQPRRPCRRITNLKSARKLSEPPSRFKTKPKLKGCRAKGITYEKLVGRRLTRRIENGDFVAELVSGQWFAFEDDFGFGFCQVDYYLICPGFIVLLEAKLTQTQSAEEQLQYLYAPVLRHIYQIPVVMVQVCKNLVQHPKQMLGDISEIINRPQSGIWTWHFIG